MGLAEDLAPFSESLGVDADFAFPHGIVDLGPRGLRGRAWWALDVDARDAARSRGPRDLSAFLPDGLDEARARLDRTLDDLQRGAGPRPLVLGGFSQGAMLACDLALRTSREIQGLVLFSGARIAQEVWTPRLRTRHGLRAFVSHGRDDDDLSFEAADSFRKELAGAGWHVTWCPFDGGHGIPLLVWRAFKHWLSALR